MMGTTESNHKGAARSSAGLATGGGRRWATVVLGLAFIVGFVAYTAVDLIQNRLLAESTYTDALAENHIYHRIYTELLADPAMVDVTAELMQQAGLPPQFADTALSLATSTLYLIFPPSAIQDATEELIAEVTAYLRGETDALGEARLNLVDELDEDRLTQALVLGGQTVLAETAGDGSSAAPVESVDPEMIAAVAEQIADGRLYELPPGLANVPLEDMTSYQKRLLADSLLAPAGERATELTELQVWAELATNDMGGALAAALWPLVGDKAENLSTAILGKLETAPGMSGSEVAAGYLGTSSAQLASHLAELRRIASFLDARVAPIAVALMALAMGGIFLLHGASLRDVSRVSGLVLLVAGGVVLVGWLAVRWYLGVFAAPDPMAEGASAVPVSLQQMVRDVVDSIEARITGEVLRKAITLSVVGSGLLVLSNLPRALEWLEARLARFHRHRRAVLFGVALLLIVVPVLFDVIVGTILAQKGPCNGYRELCGKRLDEVTFASTHNGMSIADLGWLWPSHDGDLTFQLDRGIRGLFIDTHYFDAKASLDSYFRDASPEVREVVGEAIDLLGLETREGTYLCHLMCHLGATPLVDSLTEVRRWLEDNPREVVVMVIEDKISAADTEKAFEDAGLTGYLYTYPGDGPWPPLGQLIRADERLIVMAEVAGPPPDWYNHVWDFTEETPYSFSSPDEFSCAPNRGGEGKPLFLLNHWIERASPSRTDATEVNDYKYLLARARQCADVRGQVPNFVAVNFFLAGDVVEVADALNGVGASDSGQN